MIALDLEAFCPKAVQAWDPYFTTLARLLLLREQLRNLSAALASNGEKTMLKRILLTVIFALLASASGRPASAETIDTFQVNYDFCGRVLDFSGAVEPDGFVELAGFNTYFFYIDFISNEFPKADVSLFSYSTTGGPSSLDFIVSDPAVPVLACGGASIALFAPCNAFGRVSTSATIMIFTIRPTPGFDLPTITLLSSTSVPEPPTWAMLLAGFAGIGFVAAISRGRGARAPDKARDGARPICGLRG